MRTGRQKLLTEATRLLATLIAGCDLSAVTCPCCEGRKYLYYDDWQASRTLTGMKEPLERLYDSRFGREEHDEAKLAQILKLHNDAMEKVNG